MGLCTVPIRASAHFCEDSFHAICLLAHVYYSENQEKLEDTKRLCKKRKDVMAMQRSLSSLQHELVPITINVGEDFKSIVWKAQYDMDFNTECLFCFSEQITGYRVEDEAGHSGKVAVCPHCEKVNAIYA
jgi:hypothetical protein